MAPNSLTQCTHRGIPAHFFSLAGSRGSVPRLRDAPTRVGSHSPALRDCGLLRVPDIDKPTAPKPCRGYQPSHAVLSDTAPSLVAPDRFFCCHRIAILPEGAASGSAEFAHFKLCGFCVGGGGYNLALCLVCGAWFCRTVFSLSSFESLRMTLTLRRCSGSLSGVEGSSVEGSPAGSYPNGGFSPSPKLLAWPARSRRAGSNTAFCSPLGSSCLITGRPSCFRAIRSRSPKRWSPSRSARRNGLTAREENKDCCDRAVSSTPRRFL